MHEAIPKKEQITVEEVNVSAYTIPTDHPESDGTYEWEATTLILVEISAGGRTGIGYTYSSPAVAGLIQGDLVPVLKGENAWDIPFLWQKMVDAIRNFGRPGISSMAIAAVDCALWDLKARLLGLPLVELLGKAKTFIPVYASGGFTSYSSDQLKKQLNGWVAAGFNSVKIKVGRHFDEDVGRVKDAREAIGDMTKLFIDANGAYSRKQALYLAEAFADHDVCWFEEPVASDDREGLRLIRDHIPPSIDIAAGEYGYGIDYFRHLLDAGSVDVVMADITRCAGVTGFLKVAALCEAWHVPMSSHCAPSLHLHVCCALNNVKHAEYFHDHFRIEELLFDGFVKPRRSVLQPDLSRPGFGLEFKHADAEKYRVK